MAENKKNKTDASNAPTKADASASNSTPAQSAQSQSGDTQPAQHAKKKKSKKLVIVGVVVVVIVVIGLGFNAWHNQPSFCNSVCHTPMDNYVNGYYNESTQSSTAFAHQAKNVGCLQCHEATLEEQVNEAKAWVSGSYKMNSNGQLKKTLVTADKKMCVKSGCHDWNDVVQFTDNWGGNSGVNPHRSHQGEAIDCSNCHGVHTQSMMYCNTCHDFKVPDGWATPTKSTSANSSSSTSATTSSASSSTSSTSSTTSTTTTQSR